MPHTWDPERYLTYADERGRPFVELIGRIDADQPVDVVDLGCGPGNLTTLLRARWPEARVRGLDSSPEMIDRARVADPAIDFEVADLRAWAAGDVTVDVLVSNAHTRGVAVPNSHDPALYLETLTVLGMTVDAWETTYLHVLSGDDPVFTWVSGTGARPTLQALPDDLRPGFEAEFKRRLREAYPEQDGRVVLPFRRIFVVGRAA